MYTLEGDVGNGGGSPVCGWESGEGVCGKSLHLPLHFAVTLNLFFFFFYLKILFHHIIQAVFWYILIYT